MRLKKLLSKLPINPPIIKETAVATNDINMYVIILNLKKFVTLNKT